MVKINGQLLQLQLAGAAPVVIVAVAAVGDLFAVFEASKSPAAVPANFLGSIVVGFVFGVRGKLLTCDSNFDKRSLIVPSIC